MKINIVDNNSYIEINKEMLNVLTSIMNHTIGGPPQKPNEKKITGDTTETSKLHDVLSDIYCESDTDIEVDATTRQLTLTKNLFISAFMCIDKWNMYEVYLNRPLSSCLTMLSIIDDALYNLKTKSKNTIRFDHPSLNMDLANSIIKDTLYGISLYRNHRKIICLNNKSISCIKKRFYNDIFFTSDFDVKVDDLYTLRNMLIVCFLRLDENNLYEEHLGYDFDECLTMLTMIDATLTKPLT